MTTKTLILKRKTPTEKTGKTLVLKKKEFHRKTRGSRYA